MITRPIGANCIILVRLICMEVENEYQVSLLVHNDLISFILLRYVLMRLDHGTEGDLYLVHLFVKSIKVTISQVFVVHEIPLTTAILITISVSFTWEINPLWMTELVTHEVKVSLTTEWLWNQSNHLMKSHSSSNLVCTIWALWHMRINLCIKELHRNGFITDNSLIMTLGISNNFFIPSPVGETVNEMTHIPIFIISLH